MNGRDWAGPIALVLAAGVSIALCTSLIIITLSPKPLDAELMAVVTTLAGAAVGAVGTYLGITRAPALFGAAQGGQDSGTPAGAPTPPAPEEGGTRPDQLTPGGPRPL